MLTRAMRDHVPPLVRNRRFKLFYATQAGIDPPTFVLFVNDPALVHFSYGVTWSGSCARRATSKAQRSRWSTDREPRMIRDVIAEYIGNGALSATCWAPSHLVWSSVTSGRAGTSVNRERQDRHDERPPHRGKVPAAIVMVW